MNVTVLGRFELASRIALDASTGSWFVVGVGDDEEAQLLAEELETLIETAVPMVSVDGRDALVRASCEHSNSAVVILARVPLENLHLDEARSLLQREHAAALVVPAPRLARLLAVAPHFTNWAGNRVFVVEEDRYLDSGGKEERLAALRKHHEMSDEAFLAEVEHGRLLLEPEHAEWLVLLGRSDLLEGGT